VKHPDYAGFVWYRRQVVLDPTDKNPLDVYLPWGIFEAEVYWNGVKVGHVGALSPNPFGYYSQPPVAFPLPTPPAAASATLALRIWAPRGDAGLVLQALQIGYAPVIQQMVERWLEHRLRVQAVSYALNLIYLCVGLTALILWLRSRSQWILLCAGAYFVSGSIYGVLAWASLSLSVPTQVLLADPCDWINHTAFLFLILLLAALPQRPGIRASASGREFASSLPPSCYWVKC
jgi:hypothetical protein